MSLDASYDIDAQNILRPQVITESGVGIDIPNISDIEGMARGILRVGALSAGTTLTAKLEHSVDGASNWADVPGGAFAPISVANTGSSIGVDTNGMRPFVRLNYTATGGTVNLVASAILIGYRDY